METTRDFRRVLCQVVLRVNSLPAEGALKTTGLVRPGARRLLLLQAVATAITPPTKYT